MSNSLLKAALSQLAVVSRGMSVDAWLADQDDVAAKVALFREYADGDHRSNLTAEMQALLRIDNNTSLNQFNDNYCGVIIQSKVDRLTVQTIESDTDAGNEWASDLLDDNRMDALQIDVHEAAATDGHTYAMVSYDNKAGRVVLTPEPAYDGSYGMLTIHDADNSPQPEIAIKLWKTTINSPADAVRINVYYPDRIEKFIAQDGHDLERHEVEGEAWPAPWTMSGEPLGVPIVRFMNQGTRRSDQGKSEIEDIVPLQDALNRCLYSMVMSAELSAFQIRYLFGMEPPAGITPGMWIWDGTPVPKDEHPIDIGVLPQGDISAYINMAQWLTGEMGKISRTPTPEFMGSSDASGEALKQREIGLLGKVRRFQVRGGNSWEDLLWIAHRVQQAYGQQQPPPVERFYCRWQDAEIRNDTTVIDNALKVADRVGQREFLRMISPVFGWDESKIDDLMQERQQETTSALAMLPGENRDFSMDAIIGEGANNG